MRATMVKLGYALSCEEHPPRDLVSFAQATSRLVLGTGVTRYHPAIVAQAAATLFDGRFGWNKMGAFPTILIYTVLALGLNIHQVGPDQDGFFQFYRKEVLPAFS